MRRVLAVIVATAIVLTVTAASASASGVRMLTYYSKYGWVDSYVQYTALPGESNGVSATTEPTGYENVQTVVVTDSGAPLTAGGGCRAIDEHSAACTGEGVQQASFNLGDGPDTLDASRLGHNVDAHGGPGDDSLVGGVAKDHLDGGRGSNVIDGRGGFDFAIYGTSHRDLRVDLAAGTAHDASGAHDTLRRIENIDATHTRDANVMGDSKPNSLSAGPGGQVYGRGAHDELDAGPGGRVSGGPGRDTLSGSISPAGHRRTGAVAVQCGGDRDHVTGTSLEDLVNPDCEFIEPDLAQHFLKLSSRLSRAHPFVTLGYACWELDTRTCPLDIVARLGSRRGPVVAERRTVLPHVRYADAYRYYGLYLTRRGRAVLPHRARSRLVVYYHEGPFHTRPRYTPPQGFTMTVRH